MEQIFKIMILIIIDMKKIYKLMKILINKKVEILKVT